MRKIVIICAIPQERRPILRLFSAPSRIPCDGVPLWCHASTGRQIFLAESGMGSARAAVAAEKVISHTTPDIVINTGFCGALLPGLDRGDIVLAERVFAYAATLQTTAVPINKNILDLFGNSSFHRGTFITTAAMVAKSHITPLLEERQANPVVEMESHAIACVCASRGIPFAAIRAVSDSADQDPQPDCSKIFAADMKISMMRILKAIIAEPALGRRLLQLRIDAGVAGESLAQAIESSLEKLL